MFASFESSISWSIVSKAFFMSNAVRQTHFAVGASSSALSCSNSDCVE